MSNRPWFRYAFEKAFGPDEPREQTLTRIQRNLEVRGVRPGDGLSYHQAVDRILQGSSVPLAPFECPTWPLGEGDYDPDPRLLAAAERQFAVAKDDPLVDPDPVMDGTITANWWKLIHLGKVGLWTYCRRYVAAPHLTDRSDRHFLISTWLGAIDDAASLVVDKGDFARLGASLRVPEGLLPPTPQIPHGLLRPFSLLIEGRERDPGAEVPDPDQWWLKNERVIPDVDGRGVTVVWPLEDP